MKLAKANVVTQDSEYLQAMEDYEEAYLNASSEDESLTQEEDYSGEFTSETQCQDDNSPTALLVSAKTFRIVSKLRGSSDKQTLKKEILSKIFKVSNFIGKVYRTVSKEILTLPRIMSRLPGCSFMGANATSAEAWIGSYGAYKDKVILDSGANITLILYKVLSSLFPKPKISMGQKIKLMQVTGTSFICRFVTVPLYFNVDLGPVEIIVDAYVVKGMTTSFILGNDFADQYALSLVQNDDGSTMVIFGGSGRSLKVQNSVGPSLLELNRKAFVVESKEPTSKSKDIVLKSEDNSVRASETIIIPPQTSVMILVLVNFPKDRNTVFIEKIFKLERGRSIRCT